MDQLEKPTNISDSKYDMNVTKELIQIIRQQVNFRKIIFNDQNLVDLGLCEKDRPGTTTHNNHLHVEFN